MEGRLQSIKFDKLTTARSDYVTFNAVSVQATRNGMSRVEPLYTTNQNMSSRSQIVLKDYISFDRPSFHCVCLVISVGALWTPLGLLYTEKITCSNFQKVWIADNCLQESFAHNATYFRCAPPASQLYRAGENARCLKHENISHVKATLYIHLDGVARGWRISEIRFSDIIRVASSQFLQ